MLHAYPDLVHLDRAIWAGGEHTSNGKRYTGLHPVIDELFDRGTAFVWPTAAEFRGSTEKNAGIGGDPRSATAEKGSRIVDAIVESFAEFVNNEVKPFQVKLKTGEARR